MTSQKAAVTDCGAHQSRTRRGRGREGGIEIGARNGKGGEIEGDKEQQL